jgi:SAM-dependent methyltransferase
MKLTQLVPRSIKPLLVPAYSWLVVTYRRVTIKQRKRNDLHAFWRNSSEGNRPEDYANALPERSEYLLSFVRRYVQPSEAILEVGCNAGRNLNHLFEGGYANLSGIEINPGAVELMREKYPLLAPAATIHNQPVEDAIRKLGDRQFGLTYTMAVLEHIHRDSEWVFAEIARVSSKLIIIEDELDSSERHFPRNYRRIFEGLGMRELHHERCRGVAGLNKYILRVFAH